MPVATRLAIKRPYGWMTNVNGNTTARGHTVDINDSFFQIVEKEQFTYGPNGLFRGAQRSVFIVH